MSKYKIVVVLWQDHTHVARNPINLNLEIKPTITIGILLKKTKEQIIVASDIERYPDRDDGSYTIIFRPSVLGIQEYGDIEIENLQLAPNN